MKKIIVLMTLVIIVSACKKDQEETFDTAQENNYKTVRVQTVEEGIVVRNDISSGIIAPINETAHISETGGEILNIKKSNGARVEAGALIVRLEDQNVTTAFMESEANLLAAKSKYDTRKNNFKKFEKLFKEELISEDEFFDVRNTYNLSRSELLMARAGYTHAKRDHSNLDIRARISGVVTDMDINLYERVDANKPLFTVVDDSVMRINSSISPEEIDHLNIGSQAAITPESLADDYKGMVYEINPVADTLTKKYPVRIEVPNEDGRLRKGMYARVQIDTGSKKGYLVPKESVVIRDLYSYIYILDEGMAREIRIERGYGYENKVEVISDQLPDSFEVVVEGQFLLEDRDYVVVMQL